MKTPKLKTLPEAAVFWIRRLRLRDWDIGFRVAKKGEFTSQQAEVEYVPAHRRAVVVLSSLGKLTQMLEEDLVHELLHLVFIQGTSLLTGRTEDDQLLNEQGLNVTADLLVGLRRGII